MNGPIGSAVAVHLSKWGWALPGAKGAKDHSGSKHCVNGAKAGEDSGSKHCVIGAKAVDSSGSKHCVNGTNAGDSHFDAIVTDDGSEVYGRPEYDDEKTKNCNEISQNITTYPVSPVHLPNSFNSINSINSIRCKFRHLPTHQSHSNN